MNVPPTPPPPGPPAGPPIGPPAGPPAAGRSATFPAGPRREPPDAREVTAAELGQGAGRLALALTMRMLPDVIKPGPHREATTPGARMTLRGVRDLAAEHDHRVRGLLAALGRLAAGELAAELAHSGAGDPWERTRVLLASRSMSRTRRTSQTSAARVMAAVADERPGTLTAYLADGEPGPIPSDEVTAALMEVFRGISAARRAPVAEALAMEAGRRLSTIVGPGDAMMLLVRAMHQGPPPNLDI